MDVLPVVHFLPVGEPFGEKWDIIVSQLISAWYRIPDALGWSNDLESWRVKWAWQGQPSRPLTLFLQTGAAFVHQPSHFLLGRFFWDMEDRLCVVDNKLSLDTILTNVRGGGQLILSPKEDRSETGQNEAIQFRQI